MRMSECKARTDENWGSNEQKIGGLASLEQGPVDDDKVADGKHSEGVVE